MNNNDTYQQFLDLVTSRYSCRNYQAAPVSRDTLKKVIATAQLAPSACNRQPWEFIIIDTPELCQGVIKSYDREWVKTAPAFIIACGNHDESWHRASDGKDHTDVDISIAIEHICLAATSLELGTCWICNFDVALLKEQLNIPENIEPIAIIPIGYPNKDVAIPSKNRKNIEDIIKWGKY